MKFFSRKALVAAAAAATISFGGAGAAMAQETTTPAPQPTSSADSTTAPTTKANEGEKGSSTEGLSSNMEAKDVKDWIGVFTAVISALGALFAFATKYLKF
ncbi:hypothetical protein ACL1FZ_10095 [Corynebacterium striatum]|nr:hypothetical protein [Corynebacterium striatum]HAT6541271.1 hypothetical protein [Corynebacterium striatum]